MNKAEQMKWLRSIANLNELVLRECTDSEKLMALIAMVKMLDYDDQVDLRDAIDSSLLDTL